MAIEIYDKGDLHKMDPVFGQMSFDNHEQIVFCNDKDTGLKAIIGIHNTVLGPSLGGTRMWKYNSEWEALNDVLRLSRGMTFKSAVAGLDLGGGKAVIIGDAKTDKTPELMKKFGEFVDSLSGRYITAEDVGMETEDMDLVRTVTPHVVGISEEKGGKGNPSPITAYGVYMGLKAADRKSTRLNSSHVRISYAVFCLKKKIDLKPDQIADLSRQWRSLVGPLPKYALAQSVHPHLPAPMILDPKTRWHPT